VNVDEVATPLVFVVSVSAFVPPWNVPLAPDAGAVNVTDTPLTPAPLLFVTFAARGAEKTVPTVALCGVPLFAVIAEGLLLGLELDPPQLIRKPTAKQTNASLLI
jgi:hypothetical protein